MRLLALLVLFAACDRDPPPTPKRDPQPPRRRIDPPTSGEVRQLPPHAIRADGIGPYKLGDKVASLLQQLPAGPRIMRFELPGIVRTSVFRAEEDEVIIGGETTSTVTFVAVVGGSEIARTEKSNVHVGSTVDDLERALGPLVDDPDRARDPRLAIPTQQRTLRAVALDGRIEAIVVTPNATSTRAVVAACERPVASPGKRQFPACLSHAGELVESEADEVIVRGANGETKLASVRIPNLVFAEPLRNLADGKDEIVAVTSVEDGQARRWSVVAYRLEGTRLVRSIESEVVYELASARTRWIGAELRDVQLFLELSSQPDGIEVGGLLTTQAGNRLRDVVVISPVHVVRKTVKPAASDASVSGGGSAPPVVVPVDAADTPPDVGSANP